MVEVKVEDDEEEDDDCLCATGTVKQIKDIKLTGFICFHCCRKAAS